MPSTKSFTCILSPARCGSRLVRRMLSVALKAREVPWDANFIWMIGSRGGSDVRTAVEADKVAGNKVELLLRKAAGDADQASTSVVEKTISNSLRPDFVEAMLPRAQFVVLLRHPAAAIRSSIRCWKGEIKASDAGRKFGMILRHNPGFLARQVIERMGCLGRIWGVRYPGIQEDVRCRTVQDICGLQWAWSVETTASWLADRGRANVPVLLYDELSTPGAVQAGLEGISPDVARRAQEFAMNEVRPAAQSPEMVDLSSDVARHIERARDAVRALPTLRPDQRDCLADW